jgi:hypothetical protein
MSDNEPMTKQRALARTCRPGATTWGTPARRDDLSVRPSNFGMMEPELAMFEKV